MLSAAGLGADVPHGVQHGLSTRIKTIVDRSVAEYTALNLPMLQAELDQQAARNRARSYRPAEGLEPEFEGLPLDPDPVPGAPFLFTISGLAEEADAGIPALPPLSDEAKAALRQEVGLADDYANMVGREVCTILLHHRLRIQAAITRVRRAADRGDARGAHPLARCAVRPERPAERLSPRRHRRPHHSRRSV